MPIGRFLVRVLVIWILQVIALLVMVWLLPGLKIDSLETAILVIAVLGLVNALLWPILTNLLLPLVVLTLGLFSLVLNGVMVWLASAVVPGFHVTNLGTAILVAVGVTLITTILSTLLTINDDNSYYRNVVRRHARRSAKPEETDVPGVLFLEIDGLSKPVLERAVREGHLPTLARWLESGSHRLVGWETDLSSQTSASQAGILQGDNHNIPAFRWYDRARKTIVASSNPDELARLETELSDGNGLLADDGASRGNMFSGDAPSAMLTASTIKDLSRFHTIDFQAYFVNPYNFTRTLILFIWDIILEKYQFRQARRRGVEPRLDKHKRGGKYPLMRAFMTVFLRELNVYTLIGDMYAGVPSAYTTFGGYDEVAHHSGVESEDGFDILFRLDQQLARLESAARQAARPYHLVILSDHGQSGGATFKQRYHMTLEDLVQNLATEKHSVQGSADVHEDWNQLSVFMTEAVRSDSKVISRPLGQALKGRTRKGQVSLGPEAQAGKLEDDVPERLDHLVVLGSGNLGLVYSSRIERRATQEEIEARFPGMLQGLAGHPGIGFVMVRSQEHGPVVVGGDGRYYLDEDRVDGENPLKGFGAHAAEHLRRTDRFPHCPDILVNSFYDAQTNEVAAFEELIGNHGGLGGYQTQGFLLFPAEWETGPDEIVGAEAVCAVLKGWLTSLQRGAHDGIAT